MANNADDVYSWLLASADQLAYPGPNNTMQEHTAVSGAHIIQTDIIQSPLVIGDSAADTQANSLPDASYMLAKAPAAAIASPGTSKPRTQRKRAFCSSLRNATKRRGDNKRTKQTRAQVLERNRRSARECRKRKKEMITELENRVSTLERENMQLRVQLRIGRESDEKETAEKWRITNKLGEMVKNNESDATILETISMFTERYADYGKERRVACRYHLDYLEKLLVPTQVSSGHFQLRWTGLSLSHFFGFSIHLCCTGDENGSLVSGSGR